MKRISVRFVWYDIWMGIYIDRKDRSIYFAPIPCIVFKINLKERKEIIVDLCETCRYHNGEKDTDGKDIGCMKFGVRHAGIITACSDYSEVGSEQYCKKHGTYYTDECFECIECYDARI